jgi:hypothetical protein
MRLREIQWILRGALKELKVEEGGRRGGSGNTVYIAVNNVQRLRAALELLGRVAQFSSEVARILKSPAFGVHHLEAVDLLEGETNQLSARVNAVRQRAELLARAIEEVLPDEPEFAFSFHVPVRSEISFDDLRKELDEIQEIFEQPLRRLAKCGIAVSTIDSGSIVFEFIVGAGDAAAAVAGLKLVSLLYEKTKDLLRFKRELALDDERVRSLQLDNDAKEQQVRLNELKLHAYAKKLGQEAVAEITDEPEENPELLATRSIEVLGGKLEDGAKIQLASGVPKEIADIADPDLLAPDLALPNAGVPKQLTAGKAERT